MTELQQTRGKVRVEGNIVAFDKENENSYREGLTNADQKPYKSVSLSVKTSPTNVLYNLDLFGMRPKKDKVKVFSNKNGEKKNIEIDFDDRDNIPAGFTCFGFGTVRTGFDVVDGKTKITNCFNLDGVDVIADNVADGQSVWIDAEFNQNKYMVEGEERTNMKYAITGIGLSKNEIDVESEDGKGVATFEQQMVVVSHELDKENKRLRLIGRIIKFNGSYDDVMFVVDTEKYEKLAVNLYKKTKFGDVITAQGRIVNGVVLEDAPVVNNDFDWGGETPEGQGGRVIKNRISELQIVNITEHQSKVYKEEDFYKEETNADDVFGNSGNDNGGVSENPFSDESDDSDPFA